MQKREPVKWQELFRKEFEERIAQHAVVYLPLGICEPHGNIAVLGLDTIKAEYLCVEAAHRFGGIVAPTQGYQIHEVGFHAPWLAEVAGNVNTYMTSMPPAPMLYFFLYQLRAFHNAGFKQAIVISGHSGGNQVDFRMAAKAFMQETDMIVHVFSDSELTNGKYTGDHAGKYEISQLLFIKSECINLDRIKEWQANKPETRFAQGEDAAEASAEYGKQIIEECLTGIRNILLQQETKVVETRTLMPYITVEKIWDEIKVNADHWHTANLQPQQLPAPDDSIWKPFEKYRL